MIMPCYRGGNSRRKVNLHLPEIIQQAKVESERFYHQVFTFNRERTLMHTVKWNSVYELGSKLGLYLSPISVCSTIHRGL